MRIDLDFSVGFISVATVFCVMLFTTSQCTQTESTKTAENIKTCVGAGFSWIINDAITRRTGTAEHPSPTSSGGSAQ